MNEKKKPTVSIITLIILFFGTIFAFGAWGVYFGGVIAITWATCTAALFLCEFLVGLVKKRFSKNIGAFISSALMCAGLIVTLIQNAPRGSSLFPGLDGLGQALACIAFLPPIIVSLLVNIGNIIYNKVMSGNADKPSDPQP